MSAGTDGNAPTTDQVDEVRLTSIHNFRDVAGPGYALDPSGSMSRGLVYRSMALTLSDEDKKRLENAGLATIVDLRTQAEIDQQPDVIPTGAEYVPVDIFAGTASVASFANATTISVDEARVGMEQTYDGFVLGESERLAFGRAVHAVAVSAGPSIVHCTAGKDRTGWISALLQMLAGVRQEDVMSDYLLTRKASEQVEASVREFVESQMPGQMEAIEILLGVQESNLRRSLDALHREFGDTRRYLVEGAGVEADVVDDLGSRLRAV